MQMPTRYSKYLRRVVASWLAENKIIMEYVVPTTDKTEKKDLGVSADKSQNEPVDSQTQDPGVSAEKTQTEPVDSPTQDPGVSACKNQTEPVELPVTQDPSVSAAENQTEPVELPTQVKCPHCSEHFARPYTLKRHIERKHKSQNSNAEMNRTGACICHHCGFRCRRICDLRKHLSRQHSVIFSYEAVSFENKAGKKNNK